ncbi:MAG: glycosyltransferase [Lachnospiraceae bacterium]|nr:glycosyltransferase [Lachnospiraceae bacterium]
MKKKKILFLAGGLGNGGAERVALTLADALFDQEYEVNIIYFREDKKPYDTKCPKIFVHKGNFISTELLLRKSINMIEPDVIIAFEYHTAVKCVLAGLFQKRKYKLIASERNDPNKLKENKLFLWDVLRGWAYKKCDCLVCQTLDAKSYFSEKIQRNTTVILNPVKDKLPEWKLQDCEKSIITFCRLEKQKNIPLLLDAFEDLLTIYPDYKLYIYGNGSQEGKIRREIKNRNIQKSVILNPFCSYIHKIAIKSHMFVSSSDYEGISNSMLEAMAMGMPVVCTDCPAGGARMVIQDHSNGILVPVQNKKSLCDAMSELISNDELACDLGRNARKISQELSVESILQKWIELF